MMFRVILMSLISTAALAQTNVDVKLIGNVDGEGLNIQSPIDVRLHEVHQAILAQPLAAEAYWPAFAMYQSTISVARQDIRSEALGAATDYLSLQSLINSQPIKTRVEVSWDYRRVVMDTFSNPVLSGDYEVIIPVEVPPVLVIHADASVESVSVMAATQVDSLLNKVDAAQSEAVIIYQGEVNRVPVAYFNKRYREVPPGALLWFPPRGLSQNSIKKITDELLCWGPIDV